MEWKVSFQPGTPNKTALIQVSDASRILLIQLSTMTGKSFFSSFASARDFALSLKPPTLLSVPGKSQGSRNLVYSILAPMFIAHNLCQKLLESDQIVKAGVGIHSQCFVSRKGFLLTYPRLIPV